MTGFTISSGSVAGSGSVDTISVADMTGDSAEFRQRAGDEVGYVRALYRALLSREAGDNELGRADQLRAGVSAAAIVRSILFSDEAIDRATQGDYNAILGRLKGPGEQAPTASVRPTGSFLSMTLGVLASDEFFGLVTRGGR